MFPNNLQSGSYCKQCENVNGAIVTLSVQKPSGTSSRHERRFTVRYGALQTRADPGGVTLPRVTLAAAVLFNIVAVLYAQIALTTLLITASVFTVLVILYVTHSVQYESALVVPKVGVQFSVKYVHGRQEEFIPWNTIDDIIINEVIHLNRVLYYLTILVKDADEIKLIPLFKFTKPRLATLECIYSEIQVLLKSAANEGYGSESGDT